MKIRIRKYDHNDCYVIEGKSHWYDRWGYVLLDGCYMIAEIPDNHNIQPQLFLTLEDAITRLRCNGYDINEIRREG